PSRCRSSVGRTRIWTSSTWRRSPPTMWAAERRTTEEGTDDRKDPLFSSAFRCELKEIAVVTTTLSGVIAAIATAVDEGGAPDAARSVKLARYLLDNGCD